MTVDLHTHSTASDGTLTPAELVAFAASHGVTQLALTDHDTVAGLAEARDAAKIHGIDFVNGIEMSVTWEKHTLHVVGLGIDPQAPTLVALIERLTAERARRAQAIGERLARLGVEDAATRATSLAAGGQITRAHFARVLVEANISRTMNEAFKRFLKTGRPAYVRAEWPDMDETIAAIQAARGIAVLAHPFGYRFSHAWRQRAIGAFAQAGGNAMEIATGVTDRQQEAQALQEARVHNLAGSLGSDFHSREQFWLAPGKLRALPSTLKKAFRN